MLLLLGVLHLEQKKLQLALQDGGIAVGHVHERLQRLEAEKWKLAVEPRGPADKLAAELEDVVRVEGELLLEQALVIVASSEVQLGEYGLVFCEGQEVVQELVARVDAEALVEARVERYQPLCVEVHLETLLANELPLEGTELHVGLGDEVILVDQHVLQVFVEYQEKRV